jgi:hypothetical protein
LRRTQNYSAALWPWTFRPSRKRISRSLDCPVNDIGTSTAISRDYFSFIRGVSAFNNFSSSYFFTAYNMIEHIGAL